MARKNDPSMTKKKKSISKKQKRKRKLIIFAVEVVVLLVLLGVLWVAAKLSKIERDDLSDAKIAKNPVSEETKKVLEKYTTIALFGLDNRSNGSYEGGNSDTIMVASINNETKEVKLVSVFRDTYLNVGDGAYSKINSAYSRGGAEQMIGALNVNLDLDIEEYVAVDWYALVKAINLLKGIDIEVTGQEAGLINKYCSEITKVTGFKSSGYVSEGVQHLDGVQALAYARIRKTAGDDFKRTERQRLVVQKMVEKGLKSDVNTVVSIVDEVFPDIKTSLSYKKMLSLAMGAFDYKLGESIGFPMDRGGKTISGSGSCVIPLDLLSNVRQLHGFLFANQKYVPTAELQEISNQIVYQSGLSAADAQ
ncbi:MAG: LCP family protein [Lachnospiraceae bacterium]